MNSILEKWLSEKESEVKKQRKEFLIKQGLVDSSKTTTMFKDVYGNILTEEEAKTKQRDGLRVEEYVTYDALDLTEEEYNKVLTYVQPRETNNGKPSDSELLQKISRNTGIVSTILIVYVILSIVSGVILGIELSRLF